MFGVHDLFDIEKFPFPRIFEGIEYAWQAISRIGPFLEEQEWGDPGVFEGAHIGSRVLVDPEATIEPGATVQGPAIICQNATIRANAYIRRNVIVGPGSVVGNASELKNTILMGACEAPHFNYVGDSIIGWKGHLGAGAIVSNLKTTAGSVDVHHGELRIDTGLRKFGALIGDGAQIGCNATLNPGSIIGKGAIIYPSTSWRGVLPAAHIAKNRAQIDIVPIRPA